MDYHNMEFQKSGSDSQPNSNSIKQHFAGHNSKLRGTGALRPDLEAMLHPNGNDFGYITPLHDAVMHKDMKLIQQLCVSSTTSGSSSSGSSGSNLIHTPNSYGGTPLHMAVRTGDLNIVKYLVSMGADVNTKTKHGGTALWWAGKVLSPVHPVYKYLYGLDALNESI